MAKNKIMIEFEDEYINIDPDNVDDLISVLRIMSVTKEWSCPIELYDALADALERLWEFSKEACSWTKKDLSIRQI